MFERAFKVLSLFLLTSVPLVMWLAYKSDGVPLSVCLGASAFLTALLIVNVAFMNEPRKPYLIPCVAFVSLSLSPMAAYLGYSLDGWPFAAGLGTTYLIANVIFLGWAVERDEFDKATKKATRR